MPDPAMINAYLQKRGAQMTNENANRVREHYAANPDQLDRAAMGLPPGLEDRVPPTLDMMLDKVIADSSINTQALPPPANGEKAPAPSPRGPRIRGQGETGGTRGASRQGEYGPGPSPSRQGEYGGRSDPTVSGMVNEQGMPVAADAPATESGILKWLLPILGVTASGAMNTQPRLPAPSGPMTLAPPGSPLAIEDQDYGRVQGRRVTEYPSGAPVITDNTMKDVRGTAEMYSDAPYARQGQRNQIQAEVDAENDAMQRQLEEQERARRAQKRTKDLGDAAKRATGRR